MCNQAAHEVGRAREAVAVKEQQCHQLLQDLRYVLLTSHQVPAGSGYEPDIKWKLQKSNQRREMDAEVRALEGEVTELRGERDRFQQLLIEVSATTRLQSCVRQGLILFYLASIHNPQRASELTGNQTPAAEALAAAAQQLDAAHARIVALEAALQQGWQQGEGGAAEAAAMAATVLAAARERIEVLEDAVQERENGAAALAAAAECEGARQCIGELRAQIAVRWGWA